MKVLFATDGSRHAEFAAQVMDHLLIGHEPELDLIAVTVCPVGDLHGLGIDFPDVIHEIVDRSRSQSSEILEGVSRRFKSRVASFGTRILEGNPAKELLHQIDEMHPDLCVVGSHGWTFSERFFLGSISSQLAKHAHCSVLVAKPRKNDFDASVIRKIVIADDGSEGSRQAIERVLTFPSRQNLSVRLVSVVQDASLDAFIPEQIGDVVDQKRQAAEERLQRVSESLRTSEIEVDTAILTGHSVPHQLVRAAEDFEADLLMLGGKTRPILERALLGSTSLSVLHLSKCSVWIER